MYKHKTKKKYKKSKNTRRQFRRRKMLNTNKINHQIGGENISPEHINPEIIIPGLIIPKLAEYSTIYISIGGKFIIHNYPFKPNTGEYQLVPQFIVDEALYSPESKFLIMIIDSFRAEENELNDNIMALNYRLHLYGFKNIDYVLINHLLDESIKTQLQQLIEHINPEQNIYIVDYVYYFNPIEKDIKNRKDLDKLMKELVISLVNKYGLEPKDLPNNKNIYKWLGTVEPNYISKFINYDLINTVIHLNPLSKPKPYNKSSIFLENTLRITPSYDI
jgi:hypothetical protein